MITMGLNKIKKILKSALTLYYYPSSALTISNLEIIKEKELTSS